MFDTYLTIVGNVMTAPEWRRTSQSNALLTHFKVASTARRFDRDSGRWIDGNSLRVRVTCWRRLAEGVASSVMVGDPVMVVGRLYTRDWTDGEGNPRVAYEMEAAAVGHDLSRGRARFARNRATVATSTVEDAEAESRARGESTESVPEAEVPTRFGDHPFDEMPDPDFAGAPVSAGPPFDVLAAIRGGHEFDEELDSFAPADAATVPTDPDDDDAESSDEAESTDDADELDEKEEDELPAAARLGADMLPGDGAEPEKGAGLTGPDGGTTDTGASGEPARARRGRSRTPVPA